MQCKTVLYKNFNIYDCNTELLATLSATDGLCKHFLRVILWRNHPKWYMHSHLWGPFFFPNMSLHRYNLKGGNHRVAQDNHITKNHSTKKNNPRPTACFINILIIDTTALLIYLNRKWKIIIRKLCLTAIHSVCLANMEILHFKTDADI